MIAKLYVEILGIEKSSSDGQRLLEWKKPPSVPKGNSEKSRSDAQAISGIRDLSNGAFGDFGTAVYLSLQNRSISEGVLTIYDLDQSLNQLSLSQDRKSKVEILRHLIFNTTALEQKWIVRIILKGILNTKIIIFF